MSEIYIPSEKQVVIVPKSGFKSDGRNSLQILFRDAGFDKVNGDFDRKDQIEQGDFVFRGIKGADALASQFDLFRKQSQVIIMGTDVLAEAAFLAKEEYDIRMQIEKLISLGIGACTLNFLAPDESPINRRDDLKDRRIFTKYPRILNRLLGTMGIDAQVRRTEGADTRVNEFRERDAMVAALEIVGTGDTARKNKLQIIDDASLYPEIPVIDCLNVSTDLFLTNKERITPIIREKIQELGLAIEAAKKEAAYALIKWNIKKEDITCYTQLGMKGINIIEMNGGNGWYSCEILVPEREVNALRVKLMQKGAEDIAIKTGFRAEKSAKDSEVLQVLPFDV